MSGWIKVEKDLATDPRVLRMASRLRNADVTLGSRSRLVIVGALVTLWWYADTHIREDDTLPIGADQVNELVGVENFCELMPPDWLVIIDSNNVKLVDYTAHNGTTAKKRALGQKRQERHRSNVNADVTPPSRLHNANCVTRPREDLDLEKREEGEGKRAPRAPTARRLPEDFQLTEQRRTTALTEKADPDREFAKFCDYWRAASGQNARKHDWDAAWRNWCRKAVEMAQRNGVGFRDPENTGWRPTK